MRKSYVYMYLLPQFIMRVYCPDMQRHFRLSPKEAMAVRRSWFLYSPSCELDGIARPKPVNRIKFETVMAEQKNAEEERIRKHIKLLEEKKKDVKKLRAALERGEKLTIGDYLIASYEVEAFSFSHCMDRLDDIAGHLRSNGMEDEDYDCLKNKKILDIACGSKSAELNPIGKRKYDYEPWLCRALHKLGAKAVGVDIGSNHGEEFEFHQTDLSEEGALGRIFDSSRDSSFDVINSTNFLGNVSPLLLYMTNTDERNRMKTKIFGEALRLLKEDGYFLHEFDVYMKVRGNLVLIERSY